MSERGMIFNGEMVRAILEGRKTQTRRVLGTYQDAVKFCRETGRQDAGSAMEAWNACRAAMLNGGKS